MVPKIMIDEAAKTELIELKVKHSEIIEKNETLSNKAQALETDKNEFETTLTKLKVCVSYPSYVFMCYITLLHLNHCKTPKLRPQIVNTYTKECCL